MDNQTTGTTEATEDQKAIDPWVAAFASLEHKGKEGAEADTGTGNPDGDGNDADAKQVDGQDAPAAADGNGDGASDQSGELDPHPGADGEEDPGKPESVFDGIEVSEDTLKKFEEDLATGIRDRAIKEVAEEFVKRGVRNTNGVLGATLDDSDICKRDSDGVPRFYNPETGREFTGDNPRRQAQEWVDDYNRELARVFDNTCEQYESHLKEESAPQLAVMRFAPTYEKLDGIRRGMLDNIIQDYEVKDDAGKVVGYSCDLDKALAQVDRQIAMIQEYAKAHQQQPQQGSQQAQTPALDMKTSSGAVPSGDQAPPSSLAEAMERLQDAQLSTMKK